MTGKGIIGLVGVPLLLLFLGGGVILWVVVPELGEGIQMPLRSPQVTEQRPAELWHGMHDG